MPQSRGKYGVSIGLYTLLWIVVSVSVYRLFFLDGHVTLRAGPYFFLAGLVWLVFGALRSIRPTYHAHSPKRDPVVSSFALAGLLLILYANVA